MSVLTRTKTFEVMKVAISTESGWDAETMCREASEHTPRQRGGGSRRPLPHYGDHRPRRSSFGALRGSQRLWPCRPRVICRYCWSLIAERTPHSPAGNRRDQPHRRVRSGTDRTHSRSRPSSAGFMAGRRDCRSPSHRARRSHGNRRCATWRSSLLRKDARKTPLGGRL
jgi:hypothetical protein